jgi:ribosomal protein S12 methylthiotransferase
MKHSVHLVSLGCAKNLVDSEVMLGVLMKAGHTIESNQADADVVIINTCGFVEGSKQESIDAILEANQLRTIKPGQKLVVAGCLAQRYSKDLKKEIPEVSAFIGINEVPKIDSILDQIEQAPVAGEKAANVDEPAPEIAAAGTSAQDLVTKRPSYLYDFGTPRFQLTPTHYAYLKIAEGCNHPCAFCSIPIMRGRHRSRSIEDVVNESRALVARGVKELLLISQDTTYFGKDLGIKDGLSQLLRQLNAIEGDFWIRILYTHPAHWDNQLMETIASCPKVCRYVDMPLQHIHEDLLLRMRRETSRKHIEDLVTNLRTKIPGIAIRTTFIVGFPGETDSQFESLLQFVKDARFERLGVFEYSQEDQTVAGRMSNQIPPKIKKARRKQIMLAQQKISTEIMKSKVGQQLKVLVDSIGASGSEGVARTESDSADIDGRVLLRGKGWQPGEFQTAKIVAAKPYDLVAELS